MLDYSDMKGIIVLYNFFRAISYNVFNIFLYKIILQLHQVALFSVISSTLFGLAGTLFSSIYFLISVTNIGFDYFIITHHHVYTASQNNFKKLIPLFIARLSCIVFVLILLWYINQYVFLCPVTNILTHTTPLLLGIIVFIFISESIKKSLDVLAQMSFLQKSISIFDISTLLLYVAFVWSYYFVAHTITLYTIFIPMAIISCIECYLLAQAIKKFYNHLPAQDLTVTTPLPREIFADQVINYINQIAKALFSPNFFIIVLACYVGLAKVGQIKLFTDIIVLLYMLLNRSFGLPTAALFSSMAKQASIDKDQEKISSSQQTFMKVINWYTQFLYALGITISFIMGTCFMGQACVSSVVLFNSILFIFAGFIEYLGIAYEKWYLTQGKAWILGIANSINLALYGLLFFLMKYVIHIPEEFILVPIIMFRLCYMIAIMYITYCIWGISLSWRIRRLTIVISAITCLLIYVVNYYILITP